MHNQSKFTHFINEVINMKKKSKKKEIDQIKDTLGFSVYDSEALLTHTAQLQTTDEIPLDELAASASVDSSTETLNRLQRENPSTILDRNGPRD